MSVFETRFWRPCYSFHDHIEIFDGNLNQLTQKALNQSTINLSVKKSIHYLPKLAILHIVGGVVKFRQHHGRRCRLDNG